MRITQWFAPRIGRILAAVALVSSLAVFSGDVTTAALSSAVAKPGAALETGNRKGTVWVVNRDQGTLMVFDADSGAPLLPKALPVGRGAHDICISERSGKAYITAETDNVVTAVDVDEVLPLSPGRRRRAVRRKDSGRADAASHRAQSRRTFRVRHAGFAHDDVGVSAIRGDRYERSIPSRIRPRARILARERTRFTQPPTAKRCTSRTTPATRSRRLPAPPATSSSAPPPPSTRHKSLRGQRSWLPRGLATSCGSRRAAMVR